MEHFRCYFLDANDHIEAAENLEADTLNDAVVNGLAMLQSRPQHRSIELWQGARKVYPLSAAAAAAKSRG